VTFSLAIDSAFMPRASAYKIRMKESKERADKGQIGEGI
jgi:hypothetical protein